MEYKLNKIEKDEYNRTSAVFAIDKPEGVTSHDVVDIIKKKLRTKKVGHAGALDPFASGILLIVVGKYTKLSDALMGHDKVYDAEILFGVSTDSHDTEGNVIEIKKCDITENQIEKELKKFEGGYMQRVPVYSSVKVDGQVLRKLARRSDSFFVDDNDQVHFVYKNGSEKVIKLPHKHVEIDSIALVDIRKIEKDELVDNIASQIEGETQFVVAKVRLSCSKGTYIRQFAYDFGKKFDCSAMLISLRRIAIGNIKIEEALKSQDIENFSL